MIDQSSSPRWTDLFIKRPVVAIVVCLSLLLVGFRSAVGLPVISFPVIESSSIAIITIYPGASAETVQGFVTEPIERAASSVPGLDYIESVTTAGTSTVTLWLQLNQDTTEVISTLSTRLSQIRFELPEGTEDPSIQISRADTPYASFYLALRIPPDRTYAGVSDLIQRDILPRLTAIPDIERVENYGLQQSMRIWLNPWKMAALNVSTADVASTLRRNNVIGTFGRTESASQRVNLKTNSEAKTPSDFANMLIQNDGDVDIRLGDVAEIEVGTTELNAVDRYNQDQVVFVGVYPEPGTSEIVVGDSLYDAVEEINESLPPDLDLFIPFDNSRYMREAVAEIFSTLSEPILLVGLVVLALMGSARTALVPLLTIPISILGATAAISLVGFSMNLLTILAIVLSVGLVVDDAIVVVENVARNLREGMTRREAALASSRRLLSPIIAMTMTLAVVYAPIGFLSGLSGVLFREFAFTLAIAVVISGFVAITLSPIMSAWVCPDKGHETRMIRWVNIALNARKIWRHGGFRCSGDGNRCGRRVLFADRAFVLIFTKRAITYRRYQQHHHDCRGGSGGLIEETVAGFTDAVEVMLSEPAATYIWQSISPGFGFSGQEFVPPDERDVTTHELLPVISERLKGVPSVAAFPSAQPSLPTAGQYDLEVVVTSSDSSTMRRIADAMATKQWAQGFSFFENGLKMDMLAEYQLNKDRMADLGMTLGDLTSQMDLFSEGYVTRYDERGRAYRVIPSCSGFQVLQNHYWIRPHCHWRPGAIWHLRHPAAQHRN